MDRGLYGRDVTIYHYKIVTNLVFLNYIPQILGLNRDRNKINREL
jgi:hypothetical protein